MKKIDPQILKNLEAQNFHAPNPLPKEKVLAVDYGEKFCGLAFSPDSILTFPLIVFKTTSFDEEIKKVIEQKKPDKIVFGLPLGSDGFENFLCKKIRQVAKKFKNTAFINERFSSQNTISKNHDERIDDLAAAKILEFYLHQK